MEGLPNASRNRALDIDLSDVDFDDESTSDDVTDVPPTPNKAQVTDKRVRKFKANSTDNSAVSQLTNNVDDQLLSSITYDESLRVSELELKSLAARKHLEDALQEGNKDDIAAAKQQYMSALQNQLNYHEYLGRIYADFVDSNFNNRIDSDSLLSESEIAKLNLGTTPASIIGYKADDSKISEMRQWRTSRAGLNTTGDALFKSPAQMAKIIEAKKKIASEIKLPDGWEIVSDDDEMLKEIAKIPGRAERRAAFQAYTLNSRPRHLVLRPSDPRLAKHRVLLELDKDNEFSLIPTQEEIDTILGSISEFDKVIDLSNLQSIMPGSLMARANPSGALEIKVGTLLPITTISGVAIGQTETDAVAANNSNAATHTGGELSINLKRMRLFDDPEFRKTKEGFYWRDPENAKQKLRETIFHEIGHQVLYATLEEFPGGKPKHASEAGEVDTKYSLKSEGEHFAESISRFVATGEATDRIRNILESNNLIGKPEAGEKLDVAAEAEDSTEPFAGATTVAAVQAVLKKAGVGLSTKSSSKYARTNGIWADAVDRNGGNSYTVEKKRYKKSGRQGGFYIGTKEVPIKEAVKIGYNNNSTLIKDGSSDRFASDRDFNLSKAIKALEAAGFDVTPMDNSPYEFLVTKKVSNPAPEAEGLPERDTGLFNEYSSERADQITAENTPLTDLGFDPEEEITIYRGVPSDVDSINAGDWVTTLPQLAKDYAGAGGKVVSSKVKAKDLMADPSSGEGAYTEEMVYRPQGEGNSINDLPQLGIDFQTATMDASGTRLPTPGAFTGKFQDIMKGAKNWKEVQDRLKGQTVTYFDFETTGISDYDGQDIANDPIQLGAVQVKDGKIVKRFNVYMNPESKLSKWSSEKLQRDIVDENGEIVRDEQGKPKTTLVTPEWLAQQKSKDDAIREFIEFIGPNALLGGQNVPFDMEILKRMADSAGVKLDIAGTIDSKDLASLLPKYDPEKGIDGPKQLKDKETGEMRPSSSLGPVANFLGFEPANWHSADGDAEDSYNLVSKIIDRAAKEDNQDLSLLDFPLMKKRYEERMAEFKDIVSPNNPVTEKQKEVLEEFSNSSNPEISKLAKDALATATTRGDAAKALEKIHAMESSNISPEAEESPELSPFRRFPLKENPIDEIKGSEGLQETLRDGLEATKKYGWEPEFDIDEDGEIIRDYSAERREYLSDIQGEFISNWAYSFEFITDTNEELRKVVNGDLKIDPSDISKLPYQTRAAIAGLELVEASPLSDFTLFRGIRTTKNTVDAYKVGESIELPLSSFTTLRNEAKQYWSWKRNDIEDGGVPVEYELEPGARAIPLVAFENYSAIGENVTAGRFEIVSVEKSDDPYTPTKVKIRQLATFSSDLQRAEPSSSPAPEAEESPDGPSRNRPLDIDLSDFDFDDDGEFEPNEIVAAAKAIAASGFGMNVTGKKTAPTIDVSNTKKISIADSNREAVAPSPQATEIKNSIIELGSKVRESAEKRAGETLRKDLSIPDDADVKEFISNKIRELEHENQRIDAEIMSSRSELEKMLIAEVEKEAANLTEEDLKTYLRGVRRNGESIPEEEIALATLDNSYKPKIGKWRTPYLIYADENLGARFDTGGAMVYNFRNLFWGGADTNRMRLAAVRLAQRSKNSDFPEVQNLADEANAKFETMVKNRKDIADVKEKKTFAFRDALVDTLKENKVEFDSVDLSQYIGKWEPRVGRYSEYSKLSKKTRAEIEKAFQYIPKDFLLAAISYLQTTRDTSPVPSGPLGRIVPETLGRIKIVESGARAHYNSDNGTGGTIRGDDHNDFVHEFWHFFQYINPDIGVLEHAFTYDRIKDENGNLPSTQSKDWSFVFDGGDFVSTYTSKQYPRNGNMSFSPNNRSTEVGSTGMEDLFTSPGRYSMPRSSFYADTPTLVVGSGRNRSIYTNPHMDIATGIWYTDSSMTTKIPGQDIPNQKIRVRGRLDSLGEDTNFRDFNIGMLLSMLDWSSK